MSHTRDSHSEGSTESTQADGRFRQPHSCSLAPPGKPSEPAEATLRASRGRSVPLGSFGPSLKIPCTLAGKYYDGPNARRDAEEALRTKWLQELEALLTGTKTPMGEALSNRPGDRSFLGGGRGASTLRARVRASKKYLAWLAVSADVAFPSEVSHLTGFLESRHSEPCNRGAEDVAGIDEKLTTNALYTVVYRELLATAQPGRTPRLAPRYPVAVLESLEELVLSESATFFLRVYAWWLLLQCWGTLRFADHRGLNPGRDFEVRGNALEARLTDPLEDHWCRPKPVAQVSRGFRTLLRQEAEPVVLWLATSHQESGLSEGLFAPGAFRKPERLPTA